MGKRGPGNKKNKPTMNAPGPRSSRVNTVAWYTPPANPPAVAENKWRTARLKINVAAAGDSGAVENITPARLFLTLKSQQGLDIPPALTSVRVSGVFSYALAGVANAGGQVYPSTKIRVYTPKEDSTQGVLIAQREDSGTLDSVARIGYKYPVFLGGMVLNGASTAYFVQIENYHCARGFIYIDCSWTANPN